MNKVGKKEIVILIICVLTGFALRFYTFNQKSLWLDEIHTFNDSRDGLKDQFRFYKENPSYLHPPLFFILTHQFYPFTKPERDLRIIPLIFGTLSIPMIYLFARCFSAGLALPCAITLTFMTYHISLSQEGRSYALLMFFGMSGLYFLMKNIQTSRKRYLLPAAASFAILFHTSYSSIPFITLSQALWFYRPGEDGKNPRISSFLILNGLLFFFCLPWIIFVVMNYNGQRIMDPFHTENPGSFWAILYGIFHDWVPLAPLTIASLVILILSPFFSKNRKNALILLVVFIFPIGGLHLCCKLLNVTHFVTSRYFINFLPLFFISIYLSLDSIEARFIRLRGALHLRILFIILFIASNMVILPLYYRSEKQDLRGLVSYLKTQLRGGDKIFVEALGFVPGMLHYFGSYPETRQHLIPFWEVSGKIEYRKSFVHQGRTFTIYQSSSCCSQYVTDGNRIWIVTSRWGANDIKNHSPCVLKGYFDGSFLNFSRFPYDASIYLFLWDPRSPGEKGIDMPNE